MRELPPHLMRDAEADYLVDLATEKVVLELGCFRGRTTARMAKVAHCVWTVDNHHDSDIGYPYDSRPDYFAHLEDNGVSDRVVSIVGNMDYVLPALAEDYFDLIIVDGAHDYNSVQRDVAAARWVVKWPGVIAMHDWDLPDVVRVGRAAMGEPTKVVDRLAIFEGRG